MTAMKCNHVNRVPVHPSVVIGGVSIGSCQEEAMPGCVVCFEHVSKDTLAMMVTDLVRDYEKVAGKPHPHYSKTKKPRERKTVARRSSTAT